MYYFVVISETTEVNGKPESLSGIDSGRLGKASPSVSVVKTEWYQNKSISFDFQWPYTLVDMQNRLMISMYEYYIIVFSLIKMLNLHSTIELCMLVLIITLNSYMNIK